MMRPVGTVIILAIIAATLNGCGGGGGAQPTPAPTPAPPAPTPPPTPAPPTPAPPPTAAPTQNPEDIPNPFCDSGLDDIAPLAPAPAPGQPIGWNPTSKTVGDGWCQAHVPEKNWNLNNYCGTASALKANSSVLKAKAVPSVKVLTYNLYWWQLFGVQKGANGKAGKNMAAFGPYDLMGFQECEDMPRVLKDAAAAGMNEQYTEHHRYESYVNVCMAFRTDKFDELASGSDFVAEDRHDMHYGKRVVQWVRLNHKESGKKVFFMNHHGPTPPGTGGSCGNRATSYNILKVIAENAKVGDSIIVVGDFNAPWLLPYPHGEFKWGEEAGVLACHIPHVFANSAAEDMNGLDNFYSACTKVTKKTIMPKGGSDHMALNAVFELHGSSADELGADDASMIV